MANPTLLTSPIAENGDKNIIPATTGATTGLLDQEHGFQQINELPLQAGGLPPQRKDFNGVFNLLSGILYMAQRGYTFEYDNTFPYVVGCIVIDPLDGKTYRCINGVPAGSPNPSTDATNWTHYDCLPISGGTMTSGASINGQNFIQMVGGDNSTQNPMIRLYGGTYDGSSYAVGSLQMSSAKADSTDIAVLQLYPSGVLQLKKPNQTKDDLGGSAIVSKSLGANGYVKRASGEIVQWTYIEIPANTTSTSFTFPISFSGAYQYQMSACIVGAGAGIMISSETATGATLGYSSYNYTRHASIMAIGY